MCNQWRAWFCLTLVFGAGISPTLAGDHLLQVQPIQVQASESITVDGQLSSPPVEAARNAIVRFLEEADKERFSSEIDSLKKLPLMNGNQVTIGRWTCNLRKRTFVGAYVSKRLIFEMRGEFVHEKEGWKARVIEVKRVRLGT